MADSRDSWTLAELAEETGLAPRTIRYYIARGLVSGPVVAGRGAAYSSEHVERLKAIQNLQARGLMLAEIARTLAGVREPKELPLPEAWQSYNLAEDVVVSVRADAAPWRVKQIREALGQLASRVRQPGEEQYGSDDSSK